MGDSDKEGTGVGQKTVEIDTIRRDVNYIGVGGCGRKILFELVKRDLKKGIFKGTGYFFFDLSDDVDYVYDTLRDMGGSGFIDVKPAMFGGGAGRVPMSAEYIAGNLLKLFNYPEHIFVPKVANVYVHSLGGGTGSGAVPMLIDNSKRLSKTGIHITCSVFTEGSTLENVNHLYTFKRCNEKADMVIAVENRAMEKRIRQLSTSTKEMPLEAINDHIVNILDLVTAARKPGAYPGVQDFKNYVNHLATSPLYKEGIRWLVPVLWPQLGAGFETKYEKYTPLGWIMRALKEGPICEEVETEKTELAILIFEAPFENYLSKVDMGRVVREAEKYMGLEERSIVCTLVPNDGGLRVCILLYPPPFKRLRELVAIPDSQLSKAKAGWKHGSEHDIKGIRIRGITDKTATEQAFVRILRRIEQIDQRKELSEMLDKIDKKHSVR